MVSPQGAGPVRSGPVPAAPSPRCPPGLAPSPAGPPARGGAGRQPWDRGRLCPQQLRPPRPAGSRHPRPGAEGTLRRPLAPPPAPVPRCRRRLTSIIPRSLSSAALGSRDAILCFLLRVGGPRPAKGMAGAAVPGPLLPAWRGRLLPRSARPGSRPAAAMRLGCRSWLGAPRTEPRSLASCSAAAAKLPQNTSGWRLLSAPAGWFWLRKSCFLAKFHFINCISHFLLQNTLFYVLESKLKRYLILFSAIKSSFLYTVWIVQVDFIRTLKSDFTRVNVRAALLISGLKNVTLPQVLLFSFIGF